MKKITVLLVDDHQVVRQGLRAMIEPDDRFEVVGEAAAGDEALRLVKRERPDVVVLDLKLNDMNGAELCRRISEAEPRTAVLILTAYFDHHLVNACLAAGARGYLLKDAENLRLTEHLATVAEGHSALDPRAADVLTDWVRRGRPSGDSLSARELEILRLLSEGLTNREIGGRVHLSENTVKGHAKEIFDKLDVHNRVEAVMRARERGLL
jgi:DNA-binding NarL/FixJ family response regulator